MHKDDAYAERDIDVALITRVEGEGSLSLRVREGRVESARLSIFEAPRYFEKIVEGRKPDEVIDIVARICGICPVAYQMTAVHAFEDAFGVEIDPGVRALRRLMYCGEWIESHGLHVYLLHAPDFLGYASAVEMAEAHPDIVGRGLQLKRLGNDILALLGGRAIHPVSVRVGGFSRVPRRSEFDEYRHMLDHAVEWSEATLDWVATLDAPAFEREVTLVSLVHPDEYPMNHGRIVSTTGADFAAGGWAEGFAETQLPGTNALHARTADGETYLVGPSSRVTQCADRLHPRAAEALMRSGLSETIRTNPYWSIAARAVELIHAASEAADIVDAYERPRDPHVEWIPRSGTAAWSTEAPRGLLFQTYEVDADGFVTSAQIVPPTSQNQGRIEADLVEFTPSVLELPDAEMTHRIEQLVRSYDPCISCATHFLDVTLEEVT
jgi:sulfhydrogenase subunit alpha